MRISVGICFILLLSAGCSTSTIVHNTPLTFEGLANAYEGDSLRSYLRDQYRWEFKRFKGDSASNFFPIQIGNFVGELTSDRHGYSYRTGDWTKALKKQAG